MVTNFNQLCKMADDESYDDIPGSEDEQLDEAERSGDFQEQKIDEAVYLFFYTSYFFNALTNCYE